MIELNKEEQDEAVELLRLCNEVRRLAWGSGREEGFEEATERFWRVLEGSTKRVRYGYYQIVGVEIGVGG